MSTFQKYWLILIGILQRLGLSNKTYGPIKKTSLPIAKRKGHELLSPKEHQIRALENTLIKTIKIEPWKVEDNSSFYSNLWSKRDTDLIDTIVIGSTDNSTWNSMTQYKFDTSKLNDVTPGKPLPGMTCHVFINASGMIEKVAGFDNLIHHTKGINGRSVMIKIQYSVTNNVTPPSCKIIASLERILVILCLLYKLDPYKAIKAQKEVRFKWLPFTIGQKSLQRVSPGIFVPMDNIRRNVAIILKKKLKYAGLYDGPINEVFSNKTYKAMNGFNSLCIRHLFTNLTQIEKLKYDYTTTD